MAQYRKKPVVIEAVQYDGTNHEAIGLFAGRFVELIGGRLFVNTLENRALEADPGDWIIRGIKGEFYPCKPDIFKQTYQVADESPDPTARVVTAALAWDEAGAAKVMHVLTCPECKRLEGVEDRWCEEAVKLGRRQLDAAKALRDALAALDGRA